MAQNKLLIVALVGAGYYLYTKASSKPVYKNAAGQPITQTAVGNAFSFDVPGYDAIWLSQLKNGIANFEGPYQVPMPPYVAGANDVGTYDVTAYQLTQDGKKGSLIGTTQFVIVAA